VRRGHNGGVMYRIVRLFVACHIIAVMIAFGCVLPWAFVPALDFTGGKESSVSSENRGWAFPLRQPPAEISDPTRIDGGSPLEGISIARAQGRALGNLTKAWIRHTQS
jgi:hypothetical protein